VSMGQGDEPMSQGGEAGALLIKQTYPSTGGKSGWLLGCLQSRSLLNASACSQHHLQLLLPRC
jgi:hypothetical protein